LVDRDARNSTATSSKAAAATGGTPSSITAMMAAQKRAEQAANAERIKIAKAAEREKQRLKAITDAAETERLRQQAEADKQQRDRIEAAKRAAEMPALEAVYGEYASEEMATRAFMDLLKEKKIPSNMSFKDATPLLALDKVYFTIITL
jgi:phage repressor protein C with HTH and peptisase S24 domain